MTESPHRGRRSRRDVYLQSIPLHQALDTWRAAWARLHLHDRLDSETIPTEEAIGRVTAAPVSAAVSSPHYHAAAMDGLAVRAADTAGASPTTPKTLRVGVEAVPVNTGEPLPEETDAVIMIEDIAEVKPGLIEILAAASPWQHTRLIGEDVVATDIVVPERQRLRPVDIGALLAAGVLTVAVLRPPRVAIIPTGAEIVPPGEATRPGQVPDFNSPMIAARLAEAGAVTERRPSVSDDPEPLHAAVAEACERCDLVLTLAGASAGTRDLTAEAIRSVGELLVHGVAIRPGKPVALGIARDKPVVALPGYPVSAMLCCDLFVVPLISHMLGLPAPRRPRAPVILSRKVASTAGSQEFLRVRLGEVSGRLVAVPTARGAGLVSALSRADGIVVIPALSEGLAKGAQVECELLRPEHQVRNTILVTGSHDVALDLLAGAVHARSPDLTVASTHVGSMAGLAALRDGLCHVAGSHLLDPETGEYNWSYVRRLFGDEPVTLVTLARRQQGFIVPPGNPKRLRTWEDLARPGLRFVNRQSGAGTRVLLDTQLRRLHIDPGHLAGYTREVYTHLAVAAMVENGTADLGLGILAAARARHLDFVPLAEERYDLVMSPDTYQSDLGQALLGALRSPEFRSQLDALGGYGTQATGEVQAPPASPGAAGS
jgi:putative molybdopterin biosynthesis protein